MFDNERTVNNFLKYLSSKPKKVFELSIISILSRITKNKLILDKFMNNNMFDGKNLFLKHINRVIYNNNNENKYNNRVNEELNCNLIDILFSISEVEIYRMDMKNEKVISILKKLYDNYEEDNEYKIIIGNILVNLGYDDFIFGNINYPNNIRTSDKVIISLEENTYKSFLNIVDNKEEIGIGSDSSTSFTTGTCGAGDTGLVASLAQFGYSAPLFRLLPVPVAAAPQPYMGPIPTGYSDRSPAVGDPVVVSGFRLSTVTSCTIDGIEAEVSSVSATGFTLVVPAGVEPGLKNLVISSAYGRLIAQGAITVTEKVVPVAEPVVEPVVATGKVNAGSFKGYVALYAKGYAGQRMSAKVGADWVVVPALASDFERVVEFVGAGYEVAVRIYIDRVLIDTINLTTK